MSLPYSVLRPLIFLLDPETAHGLSISALKAWTVLPMRSRPANHPCLEQNLFGLTFTSPIGLAAGFDKNAEVIDAAFAMGFGFVEAGTVTPLPQPGNPRPRLFRLTEDKAVINRFGFNSNGHAAVIETLQRRPAKSRVPHTGILGINIGANKTTEDRMADYVAGYKAFAPYADYITVNISSPNTPGLRDLQAESELAPLLTALAQTKEQARQSRGKAPPLLLKIAPDIADDGLKMIVTTAIETKIDGLIISNTTVERPKLKSRHADETGGLSGQPLFAPSTAILARAWQVAEGRLPLIGVGGISSGQDAYDKITAGASLVQLYTALVYHGPGLAQKITTDLVAILKRNGHDTIRDAIGTRSQEFAKKHTA